jgi:hypothetical protein
MSELRKIKEKARDRLKQAYDIGSSATKQAIKDFFSEDPKVAKRREERRQQQLWAEQMDAEMQRNFEARRVSLPERRAMSMRRPSFNVLLANKEYQDWLAGKLKVNRYYDPTAEFAKIQEGREFLDTFLESVIDPRLDAATVRQKCVEYCRGTARAFVDNATRIAKEFATGQQRPDEESMVGAISSLIGESRHRIVQESTIFKDQDWSVTKHEPDYITLGVDLRETGVLEEQVMAGVELAIGLWVRLADIGAKRPVSGHDFAPAMLHCSFTTLISDTGWLEYAGKKEAFLAALGVPEKEAEFFAPFRDEAFFENTLAKLQPTE